MSARDPARAAAASRPPVLVLVRHGETPPNRDGLLLGRADPPLTDRGRGQAAALAAALAAGAPPVVVVASPARRTRETAGAIASAAGVPVELDERLVELDYGAWEGQRLADLPPDVVARWRDDPGFAPPGGESLTDLRARVVPCCEALLARASGAGAVVAVSHVSPIKAAVAWTLGVGDEVAWRMHLRVASMTRLLGAAQGPVLLTFDETVPAPSPAGPA